MRLTPDANGDWINKRNDAFSNFIPIGDKTNKNNKSTIFKPVFSLGIANRNAWCWNFSEYRLCDNINKTIDYFNSKIDSNHTSIDATQISWTRKINHDFLRGNKKKFYKEKLTTGLYIVFCKQKLYYSIDLIEMMYQMNYIFPTNTEANLIICTSGKGTVKDFSIHISDVVRDLDTYGGTQCYPLYYYERKTATAPQLPGVSQGDAEYERKDAITDFALVQCRKRYGQSVTKEDIFYFVYGFLHSPDYRTTFANDLKKSLPRIPFLDRADDFWAFSKAGRELADLHLDYEDQPACPDVKVEMRGLEGLDEASLYRVVKMRFPDKADKSVIRYNDHITLSNIPLEAYDYVVNGRSAIEWIMERYQVRTDKDSGIVNDPNDWSAEHDKPRYILDLLLSIVTVSLKTKAIVNGLPRLSFSDM